MQPTILILALTLAACGGTTPATPTQPVAPATLVAQVGAPAIDAQATIAAAVQATVAAVPKIVATVAVPTIAPTIPPTVAPVPAAAKPVVPTAQAKSGQWTPEQVIAAFKAAGLEAESPTKMGRQDYGPAPLVGEGMRFLIPSLCADCGGRVFAVAATDERDRLATHYRDLAKQSAFFYSHVFVRDNIVVQINGDLKDDQAAKYEAVLKTL
jgi:hypothetical protein